MKRDDIKNTGQQVIILVAENLLAGRQTDWGLSGDGAGLYILAAEGSIPSSSTQFM